MLGNSRKFVFIAKDKVMLKKNAINWWTTLFILSSIKLGREIFLTNMSIVLLKDKNKGLGARTISNLVFGQGFSKARCDQLIQISKLFKKELEHQLLMSLPMQIWPVAVRL